MNILAIDTCFAACSVAVGVGVTAQSNSTSGSTHAAFEPMQRGHAEILVSMIQRVMSRAAIGFGELDRIAVTTGPGSFTGTRIGIATARAISLSADKPLVGISSLAVMARSNRIDLNADHETISPGQTGKTAREAAHELAILVDARRDQVYGQLFDLDTLAAKSEPLLLNLDDAAQIGGDGGIVFAGSAAAPVADLARNAGRKVSLQCTDLLPDIADILPFAAAMPLPMGYTERVRPLYMRPADAKPQTGKSIARTQ